MSGYIQSCPAVALTLAQRCTCFILSGDKQGAVAAPGASTHTSACLSKTNGTLTETQSHWTADRETNNWLLVDSGITFDLFTRASFTTFEPPKSNLSCSRRLRRPSQLTPREKRSADDKWCRLSSCHKEPCPCHCGKEPH